MYIESDLTGTHNMTPVNQAVSLLSKPYFFSFSTSFAVKQCSASLSPYNAKSKSASVHKSERYLSHLITTDVFYQFQEQPFKLPLCPHPLSLPLRTGEPLGNIHHGRKDVNKEVAWNRSMGCYIDESDYFLESLISVGSVKK